MPQRNLFVILTAIVLGLACHHQAARGRYAHIVSHVIDTVARHYVEPIERRSLLEGAIEGITSELDPYSSYIPPNHFQQFQEVLDQQFGGVGIVVGVDPETKHLMVISPLPDTPAYEAGLRAGDRILAIDGVSTAGISTEEAADRMRGPPGEPVQLTVRRPADGTTREVTITRAVIAVDSVLGDRRRENGQWDFLLQEDRRIALVRITNFGERTAEELRQVLTELRGRSKALILDLRDNAGGLLSAAVEVVDLFLPEGEIVSIRGRQGAGKRVIRASRGNDVVPPSSIPIVVLVNDYSASASEIVAAALQDYRLAVIVGERTYGKGTVQNLFPLEAGRSALKLTVATYWRPSGSNIHRSEGAGPEEDWGVRPSPGFEVPMADEPWQRVWQARQKRDALRPDEPDTNGLLELDPQLRKAVEYLQEQLGGPSRSATS